MIDEPHVERCERDFDTSRISCLPLNETLACKFSKIEMVPQNLNMDLAFNNVRVFKVQKTGEFRDKVDKDVSLSCEYDPQGINVKILLGNLVDSRTFHCGESRHCRLLAKAKVTSANI